MKRISNDFYDWFNASGIERGHLIPCWQAWAKRSESKITGMAGKIICNAPSNCSCGYQVAKPCPYCGLDVGHTDECIYEDEDDDF